MTTVRRAVTSVVVSAALAVGSVGCGEKPSLQQQEARQLARTCASLRERNGDVRAPVPPPPFMERELARPPVGFTGPLVKEVFARKCKSGAAPHVGPGVRTSPTVPLPSR